MSEMTLTVKLVPGTDGTPDRAASQAALNLVFNEEFDQLVADQTLQEDVIAAAVSEYFSDNSNRAFPMPTVANQVASLKLSAQPENHAKLSGLVLKYLQANSKKGDEKSLFVKRGGPQGGCQPRASLPVATNEVPEE